MNRFFDKVLKVLWILQTKEVRRQYGSKPWTNTHIYYRLNPWNPLTYVVIIFSFLIGLVLFGVVGIRKQMDNPIKQMRWN